MAAVVGTAWANALRRLQSRRSEGEASWRDSELDWYANDREGDLGLRATSMEPGIGGDPNRTDGISDRQVKAASRERTVEVALLALSTADRRLVLAAHVRVSPYAHKAIHEASGQLAEHPRLPAAVATFRARMGMR